jgi:rubrerythrin
MSDSKIAIREAMTVLNSYYSVLAKEMADEIIAHKADFESAGLGQAESIVERYAKHAQRVNVLYGILRYESAYTKPEGREPLARNEFRCFGCGEVIKEDDTACPLCGWTWR